MANNRAAEIRAEILARHPGATVAERTRSSLRHALGNGQYAIDAVAGASLHYHDGNAWQEVDTDWRDSDDSNFSDRVDRSHWKGYAKNDGTRRIYPRRDMVTEYVEFGIPEYWRTQGGGSWRSLPPGIKNRSADRLTFDGQDVQIAMISTPDRMKLDATLKTSAAPTRLRWPITLVGLTLSGSDLISAADQSVVARLPAPRMRDAARVERAVSMSVAGGYVEYRADTAGLTYPIEVDPTIDVGPITVSGDVGRESTDTTTDAGYIGYLSTGGGAYVRMAARFTGITIPAGATISTAAGECVLTIYSLLADPDDSVNALIDFEDTATPAQISGTAKISTRTGTSATDVSWVNASLPTGWNNSPNLAAHVQELVDSYTYSSGVMLCRLYHNYADGFYVCYQADYPNQGPKLHIVYTTGGGGTTAPFWLCRSTLNLGLGAF